MDGEDILLRAEGDASGLEDAFEDGAQAVERAMESAQAAVDGVDPSPLAEAGAHLGESMQEGAGQAADALEDLAQDLDAAASAAQGAETSADGVATAHERLATGTSEAADAAHRLASTQGDVATAHAGAAQAADDVASATDRAAEASEQLGSSTRRAADTGQEGAQRLRAAVETLVGATGDAASRAEAAERAYRALGDSPRAALGAASDDLQRQVVLLADLDDHLQQLDAASRQGLEPFAQRTVQVSRRLRELDQLIDRQGEAAVPQLRAELERLRRQYRKTFDEGARRAAQVEVELDRQTDSLQRMQTQAGATDGQVVGLTEAVRTRFPAAGKAIESAALALDVFQQAFQGTRRFIEFLERDFGLGVDAFITRVAGLEDVADGIVGTSSTVREELERVGNQLNILEKTGTDVSELRQEYEELQAALKDAVGTKNASGTLQEFSEINARTARAVQDIEQFVVKADTAFAKYSETQKQVGTDATAAAKALEALAERAVGAEVGELTTQYLQLVDAFRLLEDRAESLRDTPVLDQFKEEADDLRGILAVLPPELAALFEKATGTSADDALAKLDGMATSLGLVGEKSEEAAEKAQKAAEETARAWEAAAQSTTDAWSEVEDQLFNLEGGADLGNQFREALAGSGFLEAFRELAPAVQQEVAVLISQLDAVASSSTRLDASTITSYGSAIRRALGDDAADAALALSGALGEIPSAADTVVGTLLAIANASRDTASGASELDATVGGLNATLGEGTIKLSSTGETLAQIGEAARQTAGDVASLDADAAAAASGVGDLGTAAADTGAAADGARLKIEGTGDSVRVVRQEADAVAQSVPVAADALGQLGEAASATAPPVQTLASAAQDAGANLTATADAAERLASAEGVGPRVEEVAAAAEGASPAVSELADHTVRLADGLSTAVEQGSELPTVLEDIGASAESAGPSLDQHGESVQTVAEGYAEASGGAERLTGSQEPLVSALESTGEELSGVGDDIESLNADLPTLEQRLGDVEQRLQGVGQAAGNVREQLDALASPDTLQRLGELVGLLANARQEAAGLADELERADQAADRVAA